MDQPRTKEERLAEFLKRLNASPAAASLVDAFALVCETLNRVEDEWTDIPFNQATSSSDGRLYPPLWDELRDSAGVASVKQFRHRGHRTYFAENGAIEIQEVGTRKVVLSKSGRDGRGVWQS